eukprot:scaffold41205_cov216-Skeletonema_dohrnii-CCMP3373.AAC.2
MMKEISLSLEYQQAKRNYKASKSANNAENKENEAVNTSTSAASKTSRAKVRKSKKLSSTKSIAKIDRAAIPIPPSGSNGAPNDGVAKLVPRRFSAASKSKSNDDLPPPTKERGLELLELVRPSDSRAEFGLSNAIQTHLIESIKLCSLKSRRETSLVDMVKTLCNHLSNRENEIANWTEFADTVAIAAASKLQESLVKFNQARVSRDNARESARTCQMALQNIRTQYTSMKEAHVTLKQDVVETLSTISPLIAEMRSQMQLKLGSHIDYLHSESKTEVCDAVEELAREHDNEKQQLETTIHSLTQTVNSGTEKIQALQDHIDSCQSDLDAEKKRYSELQDELGGAQDRIQNLEQSLENEQLDKQRELSEMDARMNKELDDIKIRVKESFQELADRKDKEIAAALQRAQVAEKVLAELQVSLGQMIPSSEQT